MYIVKLADGRHVYNKMQNNIAGQDATHDKSIPPALLTEYWADQMVMQIQKQTGMDAYKVPVSMTTEEVEEKEVVEVRRVVKKTEW